MRLRVARMGGHAARFLTSRNTARIAAVFERSLYFEADGAFCCVGTGGIGNGPINAVIEGAQTPSWLRGTQVGQHVEISGACARWPGHRLEFAQAQLWRPEPWPEIANASGLQSALACVDTIAARAAPPEGLSRCAILPTSNDGAASPLDHLAVPRIKALSDWIFARVDVEHQSDNSPAPPVDLLGLGPGLTPSGDDVLCGVLIALDAIRSLGAAAQLERFPVDLNRQRTPGAVGWVKVTGRDPTFPGIPWMLGRASSRSDAPQSTLDPTYAESALAAAIQAAAPTATSPLSAAFLKAAAEGQGSEALHRFIAAAIAADLAALPEMIAALGRIGHTSGWDAMGGAVLTLKAAANADRARQSP